MNAPLRDTSCFVMEKCHRNLFPLSRLGIILPTSGLYTPNNCNNVVLRGKMTKRENAK